MKINKYHYPYIIVVAYIVFVLIGLLLGFRPTHSDTGHSGFMPFLTFAQTAVFLPLP
jgi:hypothetical protein